MLSPTRAADDLAQDVWVELARLHPRLCPRQVLGVRIGGYAGRLLGLALPRSDKRLLALVETDGCFADGVSVATGCWLGHRTLRLVDCGKVAATFVDVVTERAIRIRPDLQARALAERRVPIAASRWHAHLEGYRCLPADQLLRADEVVLTTPLAAILGRAGERSACRCCAEEIINQRYVTRRGTTLCRSCAAGSYFAYGRGAAPNRVR
ncbi:MAG: formylmethanofuran dehydrogenase [Chloroflexi bacterium]|nr:formylmethanofuran dehydrogenase [Chloroflexota bacterium]